MKWLEKLEFDRCEFNASDSEINKLLAELSGGGTEISFIDSTFNLY